MKSYKLKRMIGAMALAGIVIPAYAADPEGWYIGGSAGQARAKIDENDIVADLLRSGFTTSDFKSAERESGYKLFAGYRFNRHLALEGGYFDLGTFNYRALTDPNGILRGGLEFQGWNLDLLGIFPITERAAVFSKIGVHRSKAKVDFEGDGAVNVLNARFRETQTDYKLGVGVQYSVTDALGLRLELERYRMDDAVGNKGDIDMLSAGLVYHFQRPTPAPAPRAEAPVQAAAPPPPRPAPPAPAPAPPPPATAEYCSLLEIQFEINQSDIQPAEREKLAVLASFLARYPDTRAVIEGHTDNVGSAAHNMQLSKARAENVVNYLAREHRIDRSRLRAEGRGSARPIADNSTEAGKRANRRISAVVDCATDVAGLEPMVPRTTLGMQMQFDDGSASIKPAYRAELAKVAEFLAANPRVTATVEGHTDDTSPDMAQTISRQRAQAVADHLVQNFNVDRARLNVQGFGAARRVNYNTSAAARQENRRVNIVFQYPN
ncbi:MAG: OmpA family protein [Gammaproteobacteria bacterium]|nr:OmpA family protein [Gammaproteobacteria bacterium]